MKDDRNKTVVIVIACALTIVMLVAETRLLPSWNTLWWSLIVFVVALAALAVWLLRHDR